MTFYPRLARNLVLVRVVPIVLAWVAISQLLPLESTDSKSIRASILVASVLLEALAATALWYLSAPLRQALAREAGASPEAVLTAQRLPALMATVVMAGCVSAIGVTSLVARGISRDIAVAAIAGALAAATLAAMLTYTLVSLAVGQSLVRLGPVAVPHAQGTVRGKILAVSSGVLTITVLLFGSLSYARYRASSDTDHVEALSRSQQGAVAMARGKLDAQIAEFVWLSSGSPTALLGVDGKVLAQFGPSNVYLSGSLRRLGVERVANGWVMRRSFGHGTILASWLPDGPLEERRASFWSDLLVVGLLVCAAAGMLVWFASRAIAFPVTELCRAADRLASGDLGASPASVSRDEMGLLAVDMRRMAQGLAALVGAVQEATHGVAQAARELSDIEDRVKRGALDQRDGAVSAGAAVEAMHSSITLVGKGIEGLSDYVSSTSAAVGQMATALESVRRQGAELQQAMNFANKDVEGLAEAGDKAQTALRALDQIAEKTGETLGRVNTSLSNLEMGAVAAQLSAAQAEELSQVAGRVVEESVRGIESVRAAVGDAQQRVTALGRRAGDIDHIVDFISDVAGRTNLLSLNASIIATQAGEHGKAFAVVADQIRELAAQIASSTKSIGDIIRAVREDVEGTATLISRGDALAADGVELAQNSARSLKQIRGATTLGSESAARIQSAVQEHVQSSREISDLVAMVADGSHSVSEAFQRIGSSVTALQTVERSVANMADRLNRALEDQTTLGRGQLQALERINVMIEEITRAVTEHGSATQRVRESLHHLGGAAAKHETSVKELSDLGERMRGKARDLAERVGRFKLS